MKYLFLTFVAVGLLVACTPKTTEIIEVVEVTTETTETGGDMPKADIAEGKVVFLENCIGCHSYGGPTSAESIDKYSKERMDEVLPAMIENAELNEEKSRQVRAYIAWELEN